MYKLIIAEDEELMREGLTKLIVNSDCGFEVVGQAEDGEQALRLIKDTKPDVLITDISMPKLNGLELVECIRDINPEIKVIIISGYDDFEYARKAMRLGVQDYLLKPVLPEQIREVLIKTRKEIEKQQDFLLNLEDLKKQISESLPIVRERFFNEIINGKLSKEEVADKLLYLNLDFLGDLFGVVILKTKQQNEISSSSEIKEDIVQYFLIDIANKVFNNNIKVYAFARTDYETILLVCIKAIDVENAFIMINQSTSRLVASLQKYMKVSAFAAIGKLYTNIYEFKRSYEEASEALNYNFSQSNGSIINYGDICLKKDIIYKRPVQLEENLLLNVKLCEKDKCVDNIKKIFEFYKSNPTEDMRRIKINIFELITFLFGNIEASGGICTELLYASQISSYAEIQKCDDVLDLKKWLLAFVETYINELEKMRASRSISLVQNVKEMADICIRDENFSLDDVVSKLFISPNYLRQIFKQHTGESFVKYLTRIRMEKAALLLKDTTLKIQYIAEQVGYSNQRYFAICFKKYYKLTPTDYKEINTAED